MENSRVVEIQRKLPFNHSSQKGLEEWFKNFKQSIGGFFEKGSTKTGTGFNYNELSILMPHLINAEAGDKDFKKLVQKYFDDINTVIPADGRKFEIGLLLDNNESITYSEDAGGSKIFNLPINIEDYVRYHHAIKHPFTAMTKEEGKENSIKKYYVVDETKAKANKLEFEKLQDEASAKYIAIKGDTIKVEGILAAMGINYLEIPSDERVSALKQQAQDKPTEFLKYADNSDLKYIRQIEKLVNSKIVIKEGNNYIFESDNIAKSKSGFVAWLKDEANSETVTILKARYNELAKPTTN